MEDAYITYRYAQNLAAGNGFVFNPGERVLGTSTPLYTMVLGLAGLLGLDIATTSGVLFSASLAATALLGAGILRRYGHPALSILFATIAIWGACDVDFFFGMEIPFYLMLLFASFRAALDGRRTATDCWSASRSSPATTRRSSPSRCSRSCWWRNRKVPWREGLCALGVVLPWLVFAQLYFGSVFPNTLAAKTGEVKTVEYMFESVVPPDLRVPLAVLPLLARLPGAEDRGQPADPDLDRPDLRRRAPAVRARAPARATAGLPRVAVARLLVDRAAARSLLVPDAGHLLPAAALVAVVGRDHAARAARGGAAPAPARLSRAIRALPIAALALVTLIFLPQKLDAHAQRWMVSSFYRARTGVYLTLARWIKDVRLNDVSVLMHEPGYFAYWSGSPMIDAAGLITKGIYYHGPEERRTKPDDIVRQHRPGLIVTPPLYWMGLTLDDYLPLYYPVPARILYVRRSIFTERFPTLAEHWLARDAYHPDHPALLHHPLHWNFERGVESGWVTGGSITDFVGQPRPVQFGRRPVTEDYLNTAGPRDLWASLSSPPFVIDFDEISFRFGGTDRLYTRARFIVDGQIVLEQGGDGKRPLQMHDVYWPVWSWKGKVGVLQFDDADIEDGFLAADHVQTSRYEQFALVDDFETRRAATARSGRPASAPRRPISSRSPSSAASRCWSAGAPRSAVAPAATNRSRCAAARSRSSVTRCRS